MRGSIRRRSRESWELTIDLGRDAQGKRQRRFVHVKGKKSDAERRRRELLTTYDKGLPLDTSQETVSEFMSRWLRDEVSVTTKPRTHQFYEMMTRRYIVPQVGHLLLQKLGPHDVQRVVRAVLDRGLSPTTARRAYATMHRALSCALKWGAVYRNVCDAVDAPREASHEIYPPDRETVRRLLEKGLETPHGAAFWLLAYSGMRRG